MFKNSSPNEKVAYVVAGGAILLLLVYILLGGGRRDDDAYHECLAQAKASGSVSAITDCYEVQKARMELDS